MKQAWFAMVAGALAACSTSQPTTDRVAYINGRVWDGDAFRERTLVVEGNRFVEGAGRAATVDLAGGYVVPPFCEAHNHNLGKASDNEGQIDAYLRSGIFYVGTLSNFPRFTDPMRGLFNTPQSVDTIFANGPLTASGGHPIPLRERLLEHGIYPGFTRETLPGQGYFVVDSEADLEQRWPEIMGHRPDFIKIILVVSEQYERRRDPSFQGAKGLDPALVPSIVARAHRDGLRVFAHVETAHDFHIALASGVDVIVHMPGRTFLSPIAPEDAALAASRRVPVVTTALLTNRLPEQARAAPRAGMAANLRLLRDAGVTLAAGSDEPESDVLAEIEYLQGLNVFSPGELLNVLTRNCARTLFPNRRVGVLESGAEASFLVLEGDPTADLAAIRAIRLRVKEGAVLTLPAQPPPRPED